MSSIQQIGIKTSNNHGNNITTTLSSFLHVISTTLADILERAKNDGGLLEWSDDAANLPVFANIKNMGNGLYDTG
jgi:hypothetical protein